MTEEIRQDAVEEEAPARSADGDHKATEKPLDKMTVKELREIAKEIPGIQGVHAMKKDELLAKIKEFRGIRDAAGPRKKKKKVKKSLPNVKDLKEKLHLLREEKKMALKGRDGKKVDVLRRRINRMKKLTRKAARAV